MCKSKDRPRDVFPSNTFLLANDADGRQIVSVHVKRTYKLLSNGACVREEQQGPLLMPCPPEKGPNETDIIPFKQNTDLIVMAEVWGNGAPRTTVGISVGQLNLRYNVFGERRVIYRGAGTWSFSDPQPFESIPMCYENAYGGFDDTVPFPEAAHIIDMFDLHPGAYPRNPVGKGYAVIDNKARLDGLLLPHIEHPEMMLTPERLCVGSPDAWWHAPLAWSCDWFDKSWYPRVVQFRGVPRGIPQDDSEMPEVMMGWMQPGHANNIPPIDQPYWGDSYIGDAASPALVLPTLNGDEAVDLYGLTPDGHITVQLPEDRPRIAISYNGKTEELLANPHRILISTIENGVYVVWHAAWHPPRLLPSRTLKPEEPWSAAVEDVNVTVDGDPIEPLGGTGP